ncbi:hypothetical protein JQ631_12455 [Bradyrhizobium manausense]|uniref:hypothetical protein n=1 Tax=Bradyrhizobium manausense TaxID=989370 RepID=UPI001BA6CCE6|nr:hypothetical protein [Bradyrhizobium manausense]MBR0789888.1 hypothetical protein [Bradyrhizobium manausense]
MKRALFVLTILLCGSQGRADPLTTPDGTDAFFGLGWAAAADKICTLKTYRIVLVASKAAGLTDQEIADNAWKIAETAVQAAQEVQRTGRDKWCANYRRGFLTGR